MNIIKKIKGYFQPRPTNIKEGIELVNELFEEQDIRVDMDFHVHKSRNTQLERKRLNKLLAKLFDQDFVYNYKDSLSWGSIEKDNYEITIFD